MAGQPLGAFSPELPSIAAGQRLAQSTLAATRTRRTHGVCQVGAEQATVTSSRRERDSLQITLALAGASLSFTSQMTPSQARAVARALHAAATAAEGSNGGQSARIGAGEAA